MSWYNYNTFTIDKLFEILCYNILDMYNTTSNFKASYIALVKI